MEFSAIQVWKAHPAAETYKDAEAWCFEHLEYNSWWVWTGVFSFDNEQDYIMFMLKWGG